MRFVPNKLRPHADGSSIDVGIDICPESRPARYTFGPYAKPSCRCRIELLNGFSWWREIISACRIRGIIALPMYIMTSSPPNLIVRLCGSLALLSKEPQSLRPSSVSLVSVAECNRYLPGIVSPC